MDTARPKKNQNSDTSSLLSLTEGMVTRSTSKSLEDVLADGLIANDWELQVPNRPDLFCTRMIFCNIMPYHRIL